MTTEQYEQANELVYRILSLVETADLDTDFVKRNLFIEIGRDQLDRGHVLNDLVREICCDGADANA